MDKILTALNKMVDMVLTYRPPEKERRKVSLCEPTIRVETRQFHEVGENKQKEGS